MQYNPLESAHEHCTHKTHAELLCSEVKKKKLLNLDIILSIKNMTLASFSCILQHRRIDFCLQEPGKKKTHS